MWLNKLKVYRKKSKWIFKLIHKNYSIFFYDHSRLKKHSILATKVNILHLIKIITNTYSKYYTQWWNSKSGTLKDSKGQDSLCHCVVSNSWDPTNCSPPGFSVHGILQERILEWIAIPFFRGSSQRRDQTLVPSIWTWVWSLGWEDLLEKGKATHSSILA